MVPGLAMEQAEDLVLSARQFGQEMEHDARRRITMWEMLHEVHHIFEQGIDLEEKMEAFYRKEVEDFRELRILMKEMEEEKEAMEARRAQEPRTLWKFDNDTATI